MAHSAGDRLGPYEINAPIGAGGMGEVYKARDTRLDRTVAIKVLPDHIAKRTDLLARFEREARAVASLNHPNICTLYDIGPGYMVMELIEGETLAARIEKGPIPLDQALPYALQIADALDRAHRAGVTHRDVKPPNIMLTRDGVKVLDFGLAKSQAKPGPTEETLTAVLTTEGTVMGTPQYMAPEQFAGKEADARSDIWAFGAVLYEMVTGRKAFVGSNYQSLLGAILATEPAPMSVKPFTPAWLERMVRRCLAKDPDDRWQSMRDIVLELKTPPADAIADKPTLWPWIAAAAALCLAAGLAFVHFRQAAPVQPILRYTVSAPNGVRIAQVAISPDGRLVAMVSSASGKSQLWLRALHELEARPVPFTDDALFPFWSPDSRYIGFFAEGKLKKVAASGGPAQTLCDAPAGRGGAWSRDDVIVFAPKPRGSLQRVSASGGAPVDLKELGEDCRAPVFLPDGRRFLYSSFLASGKSGVYVGSLDGTVNRRVIADPSLVLFAPGVGGDHILFVLEGILMALRFDAGSAQGVGEAFPVSEVGSDVTSPTVSANGVLLYRHRQRRSATQNQLAWFDRAGKQLGTVGERGSIREAALSLDGKSIAFARASGAGGGRDAWLRDLNRGTETKLANDVSNIYSPVWSPAGDRIAFESADATRTGSSLYEKASNGSGREELFRRSPIQNVVTQWSRDGKFIVYDQRDFPQSLWVLPMGGPAAERKPVLFLKTTSDSYFGQISPDGRWMAFTSVKTGRREVYVRPFPSGDGEWTISSGGGQAARWRADGKELFFVDTDGKMMAVPVKGVPGPKPVFEAGAPVALFETKIVATREGARPLYQYDVTADGKRFLIVVGDDLESGDTPYVVMTNWQASVKK